MAGELKQPEWAKRERLLFKFLRAHAKNLAVMCLQSDRCDKDPDFKDEVARVLELVEQAEKPNGQ